MNPWKSLSAISTSNAPPGGIAALASGITVSNFDYFVDMFIGNNRIAETVFFDCFFKAFFNARVNRLPHNQGVIRFSRGNGGYPVYVTHFVLVFAFFKAINAGI